LLTVINIGFGLLLVVNLWDRKSLNLGVSGLTVGVLVFLIANPQVFRMWDARYFAIFQNNQTESYSTPEKKQDAIENTEVLFYHEGVDSTISSIKVKGGNQSILVNGKVVASAALKDRQCQMTLGHLPMLLHKNPTKVLVVGLGTGMTLGAVSVHPEVKELTLAEIEPKVVGAARTFSQYNNHVLDNPDLKIVFNDGRNFLMTTDKEYDVITADPIHPWTQGSGYLYTAEYFKLASEHLAPGGIMCQWLPIYELSVPDLQSVVKTFSQNFQYAMVWMTHYDAEIIGSNSPILIDEEDLERRLAFPAVNKDLKPVMMASAEDFLSYFVMGTKGMKEFSRDAIVNTDNNLYLEFSTPISLGKNVMGVNVSAIARHRENIIPYLLPAADDALRHLQHTRWAVNQKAAMVADRAHALFLKGDYDDSELRRLLSILDQQYPMFSPGRFIRQEYEELSLRVPTLLNRTSLIFLDAMGNKKTIEISAVIARVSRERAAVMFVDNAARKIFGQRYFSGINLDDRMGEFAKEVFSHIEKTYRAETQMALKDGKHFAEANLSMAKIEESIRENCNVAEQ
jgi:spermidine synthase